MTSDKNWNEIPGLEGRSLTADEVANQTIQAVKENRFLVATHAGSKELMQERIDNIEGQIAIRAKEKAARDLKFGKIVKKMKL